MQAQQEQGQRTDRKKQREQDLRGHSEASVAGWSSRSFAGSVVASWSPHLSAQSCWRWTRGAEQGAVKGEHSSTAVKGKAGGGARGTALAAEPQPANNADAQAQSVGGGSCDGESGEEEEDAHHDPYACLFSEDEVDL